MLVFVSGCAENIGINHKLAYFGASGFFLLLQVKAIPYFLIVAALL